MKLKYPEQFGIMPHSWILPEEHDEFHEMKSIPINQQKFYIIKPTNSSCGRGIRVIQGAHKVSQTDESIISTYIDRPLLIKGKKFDMRMYVVVTSYHPLRVYLYEEGLARFATEDYSNDPKILRNKFVHLTNFSVNKRNVKNYVKNDGRSNSQGKMAMSSTKSFSSTSNMTSGTHLKSGFGGANQ